MFDFLKQLKNGLKKTRAHLSTGLGHLILAKKEINAELLDQIESQLLMADIGIEATQQIINDLQSRLTRKQLADTPALLESLKKDLVAILKPCEKPLIIPESVSPYVILIVGVNGVGKTTTIGKLAKLLSDSGKKVLLAAGDTFRAAAVEQLKIWGERTHIPVVAQQTGADSAAVIFDAVQAAQARNRDVLIADTAGRLHTKENLMEELKKVKRVVSKLDPSAPHEVLLVLDGGTGQNALQQAIQFHQALGVTGIILTKLDGTAKGGIIFAIAQKMRLPICYIGVGEGVDDLRPFNAEEFVEVLFEE